MKHISSYILITGIAALTFTSCAKKLDEAYLNPNAAVKQPIEAIFPSCIGNFLGSSSAAGSSYGIGGDGLLIGRYVQYWGANITGTATAQYDQMGGTTGSSDNLGSMWGAHYYGMGQNITRIMEWGSEEEKWDYVGAAWAIRAWSTFESTNQYGEIILREAFNTNLQTFKYDNQQEVYDSVRVYCFRALEFLNRTDGKVGQGNFASADAFFYGGDLAKWKKFVYGILARSYAYINNKPEYNADSVIKYTDLAMTTNADNSMLHFANTGISGTSSYYGPLRGNMGLYRQASYIADLMSGANTVAFTGVADPRTWYILRDNPNGTFRGIIPWKGASGLQTSDQPDNLWGNPYSSTASPATVKGRYLFRDGVDCPIMTATEMQFLKAEALLRKGDKPAALIAYTNAISMHFDMLTGVYNFNIPAGKEITDVTKANYLANPAIVPATADGLTYSHIMLQKYIALFGWGNQETWVDMRRYHYNKDMDAAAVTPHPVYADFSPPSGTDLYPNNNGNPVYRCRPRYNSEYLYNIPELQRIGALDLDYHTKETWFSKKP